MRNKHSKYYFYKLLIFNFLQKIIPKEKSGNQVQAQKVAKRRTTKDTIWTNIRTELNLKTIYFRWFLKNYWGTTVYLTVKK